jgi:hypothetical protein
MLAATLLYFVVAWWLQVRFARELVASLKALKALNR